MTEYLPFSTQEQANEAGGLEPGNPAMTYVDFANQMARNSQTQQEQAEAIKQAQLLTQQKTAASAAGINPSEKGYMSKDEAQSFLSNWISNYVISNDDAPASMKAQRPLKEARVEVSEIPGKPGAYRAVAFLRPHFQLDELSMSMRLVAELPAPAK